jgi:hypothetical protein
VEGLPPKFVYRGETISSKIYTTLVLWYFAKKALRRRPGKRNFLIRSQSLLVFVGEMTLGEVVPNPPSGGPRVNFSCISYYLAS